MQNDFIVNIIHRPEMVPEYSEKVTEQGKKEDIGRKALLTDSLDIFKFQQETALIYFLALQTVKFFLYRIPKHLFSYLAL